VLSLSHNLLTSAHSLCCFRTLQYVNLNFNSLTSIKGIEHCRELRHLYALATLPPTVAARLGLKGSREALLRRRRDVRCHFPSQHLRTKP
jgi:hypothetical protein